MRLFIAGIATETNTFVPFPTGEAGFATTLALGREASRAADFTFNAPLIEWRRLGEADGHTVVESFCCRAAFGDHRQRRLRAYPRCDPCRSAGGVTGRCCAVEPARSDGRRWL